MKLKPAMIAIACLLTLQGYMPADAATSGKQAINELVELFGTYSKKGSNNEIFAAAAESIDYQGMAELVFKPSQWAELNPVQRKQIASAFRTLVERRYYPRWQKMFRRGKLTVDEEIRAGQDTMVRSRLRMPNSDDVDNIVWRTRQKNNDYVVLSVNVNGKDLVSRLSGRFQKALDKKGAPGLVAWIKDKADDEEDDDPEVSSNHKSRLR